MNRKDITIALLVVTIWGANFTVIRLGLDGIPPMLPVSLRFLLAAFPAVFFVKMPAVSFCYLLAYGMSVGVGQFGCLFYARCRLTPQLDAKLKRAHAKSILELPDNLACY